MPNFFESLEGRTFLSASPLSLTFTTLSGSAVLVQPLATPVAIGGNYSGSISVAGIHVQGVTLTLAKRSPTRFVGTLTANADPSIHVRVVITKTGQTATGRRLIRITLSGSHSGGTIAGTGTGVINATGKLKVLNVVFIQSGQPFAGTVVLQKT